MIQTLIAVVWDDAQRLGGEIEPKEIQHKPYRWTTIGLLLRTDDAGVSLADEIGEDGKYRGVNFIPRGMVIEEYSLGELKKPRKRRSKNQSNERA